MSVVLATFLVGYLESWVLLRFAWSGWNIYLRILLAACFLNALIPIFSSYLRVFGYTKTFIDRERLLENVSQYNT